MKLLVIHTHPVQYVSFQLRWLAARCSLRVLYLCRQNLLNISSESSTIADPGFGCVVQWDCDLLAGYESSFVSSRGLQQIEGLLGLRLLPLVLRQLYQFRPDALVIFNHTPILIGFLAGLLPRLGFPLFLRTECTDLVKLRTMPLALVRDLALRWIYKKVTIVFPISSHGLRHVEVRGVGPESICLVSYAPDTNWLAEQLAVWQPKASALRHSHGIPEDALVLLYVGRLSEEKDLLAIADALAPIPQVERAALHVISAGSGPLESEWVRRMTALLGDQFHHLGFLNQQHLGQAYAMADALILPSIHSETWGLVVHEALAFGCVAFVSDLVGCALDLQALGQDVRRFHAGDRCSLTALLRYWLAAPKIATQPCADLPDILDFPRALLSAISDLQQ